MSQRVVFWGVMVRSLLIDIDIIRLFVYNVMNCEDGIFTAHDTIPQKSLLLIASRLRLTERAMTGLHSFSGNHHLSSFFRKAKETCCKKPCRKTDYVPTFQSLGSDCYIYL